MNAPSFTLTYDLETPAIAQLVLCRPDTLNTMHPQFWRELAAHLEVIQQQGVARVLVISSTGKHFTAGMSLDVFSSGGLAMHTARAAGRINIRDELGAMIATFSKLEALRLPVIAVVQGGCIGGGVDLLACTDLRYASSDAFFCIQEVNIGMMADLGTLQRLPKLMPDAIVKELAYTGARLGADRALACGFVNAVLPSAEQALAAAMVTAKTIASKPPTVIYGSKLAINYAREHTVHESIEQLKLLQSALWQTADVQEAQQAAAGKRAAVFDALRPIVPFDQR